MSNKQLLRELREMRKLLTELHKDARGDGHGQCPCERTGPLCPLHAQVRQHILTAENSLRDATVLVTDFSMNRSR